jgi:hypothetical protein
MAELKTQKDLLAISTLEHQLFDHLRKVLNLQNYQQYRQVWNVFVQDCPGVNEWSPEYYSLLSLMLETTPSRDKKLEVLGFFLGRGLSIDAVGEFGNNLLWDYIWKGGVNTNWLRVLLNNGANPYHRMNGEYCIVIWLENLPEVEEDDLPNEVLIVNTLSKYMRRALSVERSKKTQLDENTRYQERVFEAKRQLRRFYEKWIILAEDK